jgi:hypothetical protein
LSFAAGDAGAALASGAGATTFFSATTFFDATAGAAAVVFFDTFSDGIVWDRMVGRGEEREEDGGEARWGEEESTDL